MVKIIEHTWFSTTRAVLTERDACALVDIPRTDAHDFVPRGEAYLWNLCVAPRGRGEGKAQRLVERARMWAKKKGAKSLYLCHYTGESELWVREWYKRLGFVIYRGDDRSEFVLMEMKL